jgi:hypothetical protein
MNRLSRNDVVNVTETMTTAEDIERELAEAPPRTTQSPKKLPLDQIHIAEKVFQWRLSTEDVGEKTGHTLVLAQAVEDNKKLAPLVVWWGGTRFYLIEGHHRWMAYHTADWHKPVEVKEFTGTLSAARRYALKANSKDKLRLTRKEKSEAAWKALRDGLFKDDNNSASQQVALAVEEANVSRSIAWEMWGTLKDLQERGEDTDGLTWSQASMMRKGRQPEAPVDNWLEEKAQKMAGELAKAKVNWKREPEVTALALEMLYDGLPQALMRQWAERAPDAMAEVAREYKEDQEEDGSGHF